MELETDMQVSDKVHRFYSKYPKRTYDKGQILVFADESPAHIFYLVSGKVRQYDVNYRGDEIIVNLFKPPAFFPMSWAINSTPNRYFYKAEEKTELHLVSAKDAVRFIRDNPDVMFDLLSRVYKGTDGLLVRISHLMSAPAKSRLIYELIVECRRFGVQGAGDSYALTTNETDIAARAGMSRETISREMKKLKDSGLVTLGSSGINITSLPALEAALGRDV